MIFITNQMTTFDLTVWPLTRIVVLIAVKQYIAVLICLSSPYFTSYQMSSQLHTLFWSYWKNTVLSQIARNYQLLVLLVTFDLIYQRQTLDIYRLLLSFVWSLNNSVHFDIKLTHVPHIIPEIPFWASSSRGQWPLTPEKHFSQPLFHLTFLGKDWHLTLLKLDENCFHIFFFTWTLK